MKFPKSVHPEGWLAHIDRDPASTAARPAGAALKPRLPRPSAKIRATDPLGVPPLQAGATDVTQQDGAASPPAASQRAGSGAMPWLVGVVAGAALIGGAAVTMSRQTVDPEALTMPPLLLGETAPPAAPAAPASTAEDAMLAQAPTAAGVPAPPASAPAPQRAEAPQADAPAPVTRALTAPPETLAQASPPPTLLREPAPVVTPQPAEPVQPPVLAQATPPATDPADVGITVKVREALASDAALAALPIVVSTDHGVVKLEGQAPDAQTRERATVVAAATSGVRGVDNRLTLAAVTVGALQAHGG